MIMKKTQRDTASWNIDGLVREMLRKSGQKQGVTCKHYFCWKNTVINNNSKIKD